MFAAAPIISPILAPILAPLLAFLIVAPAGPEDSCPNARQVTEALQAHVPGALASADQAAGPPRPDLLRVVFDVVADGTVVHFSLLDVRGEAQLRRTLPAPGRGRSPSECAALAETFAEIVERYLSSIAFQAAETDGVSPPPPVADEVVAAPTRAAPSAGGPRAVSLFVGGAWLTSLDGRAAVEGRLGAFVELSRSTVRLAALARTGIDQSEQVVQNDQMASTTDKVEVERFPFRLGLALEIPAGPGTLEPAVEGGVDLFRGTGSSNGGAATQDALRVSPAVDLDVGYRIALSRHLFLRPRASIEWDLVRYDIIVGAANDVIFHTPGAFSTFGLDAGVVFR